MALGPLTNVAIAMLADPGLGARLHSLYIMGGNMEGVGNVTTAAEFNFHADPEAAAAVLRLTRCPTTIATWELSYKYTFVLYCTVLYFTVLYCTVLYCRYTFVPLRWRKEVLGCLDTPQARLINKLEEVSSKSPLVCCVHVT